MPQLTQIACSAVLRMQIRFAWKSIWSCLKESRTALLLSPLTGSRGGSLSPSISSRVENIFTSSTRMATRSTAARCRAKHHGPICRSQRPALTALSASSARSPATVCSLRQHMQHKHTEGIIIHSVGCPGHLRSISYRPSLAHSPHKTTSTSVFEKISLKDP